MRQDYPGAGSVAIFDVGHPARDAHQHAQYSITCTCYWAWLDY